MAAHKDIRIQFTMEDRHFEAVEFLNEGEDSVSGDEMLRRVPDAIGEEDTNFLEKRVGQDWSRDLWPYRLATNRRDPGDQRRVRFFYRSGFRWDRDWRRLDGQWHGYALVVRRRT